MSIGNRASIVQTPDDQFTLMAGLGSRLTQTELAAQALGNLPDVLRTTVSADQEAQVPVSTTQAAAMPTQTFKYTPRIDAWADIYAQTLVSASTAAQVTASMKVSPKPVLGKEDPNRADTFSSIFNITGTANSNITLVVHAMWRLAAHIQYTFTLYAQSSAPAVLFLYPDLTVVHARFWPRTGLGSLDPGAPAPGGAVGAGSSGTSGTGGTGTGGTGGTGGGGTTGTGSTFGGAGTFGKDGNYGS